MEFDHFRYGNGDVDVFRRMEVGGVRQWAPWVLVRDSAVVDGGGKGLFAARAFPPNTCLGRYVGEIMGRAADEATLRAKDRRVHNGRGDAIVAIKGYLVDGRRPLQSNDVQVARFGTEVINATKWEYPGVHAHFCNDATGTGRSNNCRMMPAGYLVTTKAVPAYRANNAASELLWSYGTEYWGVHKDLGTTKNPLVINDT